MRSLLRIASAALGGLALAIAQGPCFAAEAPASADAPTSATSAASTAAAVAWADAKLEPAATPAPDAISAQVAIRISATDPEKKPEAKTGADAEERKILGALHEMALSRMKFDKGEGEPVTGEEMAKYLEARYRKEKRTAEREKRVIGWNEFADKIGSVSSIDHKPYVAIASNGDKSPMKQVLQTMLKLFQDKTPAPKPEAKPTAAPASRSSR